MYSANPGIYPYYLQHIPLHFHSFPVLNLVCLKMGYLWIQWLIITSEIATWGYNRLSNASDGSLHILLHPLYPFVSSVRCGKPTRNVGHIPFSPLVSTSLCMITLVYDYSRATIPLSCLNVIINAFCIPVFPFLTSQWLYPIVKSAGEANPSFECCLKMGYIPN